MNKFIKAFGLIFIVTVFGVVIYYSRQISDQNFSGESIVSGQGIAKKTVSVEAKTFTHPDYGFSFDYPADFTVGNFSDNESKSIVVQGVDKRDGFQLMVSSYGEETPLSFESIRKAADGLKVSNEKEIQIGQDKIKAFSFVLKDPQEELTGAEATDEPSNDNSTEIWFVQGGNLYQITNYSDFSNELPKILDSLRFN